MSGALIELLPMPATPAPAAVRVRRWVPPGGALAYGDICLQLAIEIDADSGASRPHWQLQMGADPSTHRLQLQPLRLDAFHQVHAIARAVAFSPAGVLLGVLVELRAARIDRLPVLCEVSYG